MKKKLFTLFVSMAALFAVFTSCKKDEVLPGEYVIGWGECELRQEGNTFVFYRNGEAVERLVPANLGKLHPIADTVSYNRWLIPIEGDGGNDFYEYSWNAVAYKERLLINGPDTDGKYERTFYWISGTWQEQDPGWVDVSYEVLEKFPNLVETLSTIILGVYIPSIVEIQNGAEPSFLVPLN